jgi:hypothetical protein
MRALFTWILLSSLAFAGPCDPETPTISFCDQSDAKAEAQRECESSAQGQYCSGVQLPAVCFVYNTTAAPDCDATCTDCNCSLSPIGNPPIDL